MWAEREGEMNLGVGEMPENRERKQKVQDGREIISNKAKCTQCKWINLRYKGWYGENKL